VTGSPPNLKLQRRIETVIRALAPVLDLVIAAGDRTSRLLDRGEARPPATLRPRGYLDASSASLDHERPRQ